MVDYTEDDLVDYTNPPSGDDQEFNEDELTDDDYNLLYDQLEILKPMIKSYGISDDKLKELLWLNYFEIDPTVDEIKKDYKIPQVQTATATATATSTIPKKKLSKLEQLTFQRKAASTSGGALGVPNYASSSKNKSKGLAGLLQSKSSNSGILGKKNVGGLAGLMERKKLSETTEQVIPKKKNGLAGLVSGQANPTSVENSNEGGSILEKFKVARLEKQRLLNHNQQKETQIQDKLKHDRIVRRRKNSDIGKKKPNIVSTIKKEEDSKMHEDKLSNLPFELEVSTINVKFHYKILTSKSNNILTQTLMNSPSLESNLENKRRKVYEENNETLLSLFTSNNTNNSFEIVKKTTKKNFTTTPSPDDNQKRIDKLADNVSKVKISNKSKTSTPTPTIAKKTKQKQNFNLDKELKIKNEKPNLSFIVMGHVDSGKSTLIGRLLYDLNIVDSKTLHKLTKESESIGKGSFSLAWIMDQSSEERNRGVTIDICQTQFETNSSSFTIIDSPGHKDYVPQMINGVTQADIAIVIIDSSSFESGFGSNGQTKEHLTIAKNLGIEKLIVVVNKMDISNWAIETFELIKEQLNDYLNQELGYLNENLAFIPASGYLGDNIVKKSKKITWYKNDTLLELLEKENLSINHTFKQDDPFILTINDIIESNKSNELVISGRMNSGLIKPGETIIISPSQEVAIVDSISITKSNVGSSTIKNDLQKLAIEGEFVELKLKKLDNIENIKVGDLVSILSNPIKPVKTFECELNCFNLERPLLIGTPFVLFRNNISIPARLSRIEKINGKKTKRRHLSSNNNGIVIIEILERDLPLLTFGQNKKLGRLVIRKDAMTVGAGRILKLFY